MIFIDSSWIHHVFLSDSSLIAVMKKSGFDVGGGGGGGILRYSSMSYSEVTSGNSVKECYGGRGNRTVSSFSEYCLL